MPIQVQAQIGRVYQRVDGSIGFSVVTQDISPEEQLVIMKQAGKMGWLLWREDEKPWGDSEVPKENTKLESKSASQRLRSVIFVLWNQKYSDKYPNFEEFKDRQMEGIIEQYKEKLD